jgi:hypothetical protein
MTTDWIEITRRNARSVQTTIGWIFWDPGATGRYIELGLPEEFAERLGYIVARCAPLAGAGPDAVIAAFGSISPLGIRAAFELVGGPRSFDRYADARDEAVVEGLQEHAPGIVGPLTELGPLLWPVGRPRPLDPLLSGWHAVNCIREWRADTHWALLVAAGLGHAEASILHNGWMGYEGDWLPASRGTSPADVDAGWASLEAKGLAADRHLLPAGVALRQQVEDDTDARTTLPWEQLGEERSRWFADAFEPPCERLLARVDLTAGPLYQPASRIRA